MIHFGTKLQNTEEKEESDELDHGDDNDVYNNIKMDKLEFGDEEGAPASTLQGVDGNQKTTKKNEMLPITSMVGEDESAPNQICKANKRLCIHPTIIVTSARSTNPTVYN